MHLRTLQSTSELRAAAAQWDDLWSRSEARLPTVRAEQLALWIDTFAPTSTFRALVVEHEGQFQAALPLVDRVVGRSIRLAGLPSNVWSSSGELQVAVGEQSAAAVAALVEGLDQLDWPLFWFDLVNVSAPAWQQLLSTCRQHGLDVHRSELYRIGQIEVRHDWPAYLRALSSNHRRQMRVRLARLQKQGSLQLVSQSRFDEGALQAALRTGFEVEDRSWKGAAGSSVLQSPGIIEFYCRQATELQAAGLLRLNTLELDGHPIAFEYGWDAKGSYFSPKVGYDPAYAPYSPGQLLRYCLLELFHADRDRLLFDFLGPLCDATAKWATRTYPIDRVVIAPRRRLSKLCVNLLWGWEQEPRPLAADPPCKSLTPVGEMLAILEK